MERGVPLRGREGDALDAFVRQELRERQKRELRRERDHVVLDLADRLGTEELARSLGTSPETAETLVRRARERVSFAPRQISARRITRDPERWLEADRHFEALGRSERPPAFPPRGPRC
jgi:hypothetical protein